jgi:hypothetical protein
MPDGKKLDPLIYEFETEEEAASYDKWFREKVQASLDDPGELIPHEEVMRRMHEVIKDAAARRGDRPVTNEYDPLISEFDSAAAEATYDEWFNAKIQAAIDDDSPDIPHDEAMALVRETIAQAAKKRV